MVTPPIPSIVAGLALASLSAAACHDGDAPAEQTAVSAEASPASGGASHHSPAAEHDARDQYALAHEIQRARGSREDLEGSLARTRAAWVDRRYRWELAFVPALCREAGPCVAMPFDHRRDPEHPIRQGWLPRLDLDPEERAALTQTCRGHDRCVVEVSGRLAQLELSTEKAPSMTLSDIEVLGTRAARADESWVLGASRHAARSIGRPTAARAG